MVRPISEQLAAQSATSIALGVAPNSRPQLASQIEANEPPRTLLLQTVIVPAGATYPLVVRGNYVYVENVVYDTYASYNYGVSSTTPTIRPDTGQATAFLLEAHRELSFPVPFNTLQITNPNLTIPVVLTLWVGFGSIRRDDSRRMKDYATGVVLSNIVYAANRVVGTNPLIFQEVCSSSNQRARIKKAVCSIDMAGAAVVTTGADFTLWLTPQAPPAAVNNSVFQLSQNFTGGVGYTMPTQIRFPSFVTGGAGSDAAICEVADIDVEVFSAYQETSGLTYKFPLFGIVVCNGAYTPGNVGAVRFYLTFEQG